MADSTQTSAPHVQEKTFSTFNSAQGANYAEHRRDYHPKLYDILLDFHKSTGGRFNTIVDVGCGPGTALRTLASRFEHAIGLDPSEGMLDVAQSLGGKTSTLEAIRFETSTAEILGSDLAEPIPDGSVDLIIAATCAHWFDMPRFWPRAAEVLKPGGTVAIWGSSSMVPHPSTPNAAKIQEAVDNHQEILKEYFLPGNVTTRELFRNMPLPWTLSEPVEAFDESAFVRREWGTGEGAEPADQFYAEHPPIKLKQMEYIMATGSPVIRWREAHPDLVGTDRDIVKVMVNNIARLLHEAGVEPGKETLKGGVKGVLLLVKKKA